MRAQLAITAIASALLLAAAPGVADHNSKNGEGSANMPNDIHNTRVETREADDNEAFKDFVKYGAGSKTVNRFDSDDTQPSQAAERKGNAKASKNQGESKAQNQNSVKTATKTQDRSHVETRTREHPATSRSTRNSMSTRSSGARKGGRKR